MEIILKDADFSQNGIVEPVNAQFQQGAINVLTGGMTTGTGQYDNRDVDMNYYNRRTTIKNIGSSEIAFLLMFYDSNKNYIGYGTSKATGTEASSVGYQGLAANASMSIYDMVRYLVVSNGQWSSDTFNPEDAEYFRISLFEHSASNQMQISK